MNNSSKYFRRSLQTIMVNGVAEKSSYQLQGHLQQNYHGFASQFKPIWFFHQKREIKQSKITSFRKKY